jgi:DNA (cytosine-5)-methyltransferase 1
MANVPKHGVSVHQNSWRAAMKAGRMPKGCGYEMSISEYKVRDGCKTWSRILGDGLCRTVTTTLTPQCSYTGQWVHYDQDRLITILEARRAQSFPDDEILLGNASQAFKIVGNSVARSVALAWGLAIRYAYLDEVIEDELTADA